MFTDSISSSYEHKIHVPNLFTVILGSPEECGQKWCIPLLGLVPKMLCTVFDALFPLLIWLSSVQSLSRVRLLTTPWTAACQAPLSIANFRSLHKLMSIESVMPSNISFSVVPFSSRLQSFPAPGSFQMSQFFTSGGQSTGVSASASVLPVNIQDWFPPVFWPGEFHGLSPWSPKESDTTELIWLRAKNKLQNCRTRIERS